MSRPDGSERVSCDVWGKSRYKGRRWKHGGVLEKARTVNGESTGQRRWGLEEAGILKVLLEDFKNFDFH